MPYINTLAAKRIDMDFNAVDFMDLTQGELNYMISRLLITYIAARPQSYSNISSAIAAATDAAAECRRRLLDTYEDNKRRQMNGQGDLLNIDPYKVAGLSI